MPIPTTSQEFLSVVEKSRLLTAEVLGGYRNTASEIPAPAAVADRMVEDGTLTRFQAGLLLEGKCRPFFVGPYKVLDRIGSGSMGVIYLCEQTSMRRRVAVKVLQSRRIKDEVAVQRFLREARAAAALNHPNVIQAFDLGREGDVYYLSMEYVVGRSLLDIVRAEGALTPRRLVDILRQAASGLAHAHSVGLIHRDIKPSNLMISQDGSLKILDLGLARFAESDENLTQGAPLGSLGFIPPEQAKNGHVVDHRADIFSLGATVYYAATGRVPAASRELRNALRPHAPVGSELAQLMEILEKMMCPEPADRYQSIAEVVDELSCWDIVLVENRRVVDPTAETRTEDVVAEASETVEMQIPLPPPPLAPLPAPVKAAAPLPPPIWKAPAIEHENFNFSTPTKPAVPLQRPVPAAKPRRYAYLKWPLALTLAAVAGYVVHGMIRGSMSSGYNLPYRPAPKSVTPNSP